MWYKRYTCNDSASGEPLQDSAQSHYDLHDAFRRARSNGTVWHLWWQGRVALQKSYQVTVLHAQLLQGPVLGPKVIKAGHVLGSELQHTDVHGKFMS